MSPTEGRRSASGSMTIATDRKPTLSVIMVSYNTRGLTLRALETLVADIGDRPVQVIVVDNASSDGSAQAIGSAFPEVTLIESERNLGFAKANNLAAKSAVGDWLLLLNPDTETCPGMLDAFDAFVRTHPEHHIIGGRTFYSDGSLNPYSCARRMTVWSLFCAAFGLSRAFPGSSVFNPEQMGNWARDSVREVDIIIGCLCFIRAEIWGRLGGFDEAFFMYGEDADLCLRAGELGARPIISPDIRIVHHVGASTPVRSDKLIDLMRAKATLVTRHFSSAKRPLGKLLLWAWAFNRYLASRVGAGEDRDVWAEVWSSRTDWLKGY